MRALLVLGLVACGGDRPRGKGDGTAGGCPPSELAPGTGLAPVEPLADGATFTLVHGPQGGWHVDTGGLVTFPTREVTIAPRVTTQGRQLAGDQALFYTILADYDEASCAGNFYEARAYVDDELEALDTATDVLFDYICPLAGAPVTVEVEVSDLDRTEVLTTSVSGTLQLDAYDVSACAGG